MVPAESNGRGGDCQVGDCHGLAPAGIVLGQRGFAEVAG